MTTRAFTIRIIWGEDMARILLGANYYPEDWDESLIDFDIEKMKECGFDVVRIVNNVL